MSTDKHNAERLLEQVKNCDTLDENKQLVTNFFYEKLTSNIKYGSLAAYLKILTRVLVFKKKPLKEFTQSELVEFFINIKPLSSTVIAKNGQVYTKQPKEFAPYTISSMKVNLKVFWKWLFRGDQKAERDEHGYPLAVSWISGSRRKIKPLLQREPLTRDEINFILKTTKSSRTKAVIAVLFESGQRQGEFLGMRISKVKFFDDYCEFICSGKTGERPVILVKSYPYFKKWLEERKQIKNVPTEYQDFVWLTTTKSFAKTVPRPMKLGALTNAIKYVAKKAGITKRVWVHGLRHSSATDFFKQGYNESEARLKYGWSKDSNMPSIYTHYQHDDLKDKILIRSGKKADDNKYDGNTLVLRECQFCSTENPGGSDYCYKCGKPMTIQKIKATEKEGNALGFMQSMIGEIKDLEKSGLDIQQFNSFMEEYVKNSQKKAHEKIKVYQ
ncbi:MAG TPA: site-specific integrase [archaeon]|nr:site-specific integrase [archaeon]